jgi:hypothetical protein
MKEHKQNFQDACREINGEYEKDEFFGNICRVEDSELRLIHEKDDDMITAVATGSEEGTKHSGVVTGEPEQFDISAETVMDEPAKEMIIKNQNKKSRVRLKNSEWS